MLFPRGQTVHENLSASFAQLEGMLADLKRDRFTGYLRVTNLEYEGILLFDTGNVIWAADEMKGEPRRGTAAAQAIIAKGKEKGSMISVYYLPKEQVTSLAGLGQGDLVHHNLTSDLTSLDDLIAKLQSDGHTGYVEVNVNSEKGAGLVLFQSGQLNTSIFSVAGETVEGDQAVSRMIGSISKIGATFNIYRTSVERTAIGTAELCAGQELPQLLQIWGELIATVEQVTDSLSAKGHFIDIFKRTLNEKARDYPFLNPITSEFQYKDGQATFHGSPNENLSEGLGVGLSATVAKLAAETPKANLAIKVKVAFQQVQQRDIEAFQKFDLKTKLDLLNMNDYERVIAVALPFLGNNTKTFIEQQCREHLGIVPEALTGEYHSKLAERVEKSAALLISREQAHALRQKIEALGQQQ
jgi:hypothetical protein